ncbi:hypothetical protein Taro_030390 [Colocasia esculenta]|uniref:Uncharacterized protein n=1 Tax=Colocasia esculenta TaxID=4460 RepID=A0A843VLB9_COLES|nr:hypothetical protein [Colocasia esculenta]
MEYYDIAASASTNTVDREHLINRALLPVHVCRRRSPASQHQASLFPAPALLSSRPPPLRHLRGVELSPPSPLFPCKRHSEHIKELNLVNCF